MFCGMVYELCHFSLITERVFYGLVHALLDVQYSLGLESVLL